MRRRFQIASFLRMNFFAFGFAASSDDTNLVNKTLAVKLSYPTSIESSTVLVENSCLISRLLRLQAHNSTVAH